MQMLPTAYCEECEEEVTVFEDESRGAVFCAQCSTVIDESGLVDDQVSFNSQNQMQGQLVRKGSAGGGLTESREVTIRRAKDRIRNIALKLRLSAPERMIDLALNMYRYCLEHGHTRGRPGDLVSAACLYIICRRQKTPHMLLDFSEALQEDIFRIGRTFFQLITRLDIKDIPLVEPWLYVERFASELAFEESEFNNVCQTSMRLISGMKKDWIQTGRRPTSVCAAALLLASRIHGCPRTKEQITKVMRICEGTLLKRLNELENSNVGKMTVGEIKTLPLKMRDDTQETRSQDLKPPCVLYREEKKKFRRKIRKKRKKKKKKKKAKKKKKKKKKSEVDEDEDDDEEEDKEEEAEEEEEEAEEEEEEIEEELVSTNMKDLDQIIELDPTELNKYQEELNILLNEPTFVEMSNDYVLGKLHEKEIKERVANEHNLRRKQREYVDEEFEDSDLDQYIIKDEALIESKKKAWNMIYGKFMKEFEKKKKERQRVQKEREKRSLEKKNKQTVNFGGTTNSSNNKRSRKEMMIGSTAKESARNMLNKRMSEKKRKKLGIGLFSFEDDPLIMEHLDGMDDDEDEDEEIEDDELLEDFDTIEPPKKKRKLD